MKSKTVHRIASPFLALIITTSFAWADGDDNHDSDNNHDLTGGAYASVQSSARPGGLNIIDKVRVGGSDSASQEFKNNDLPILKQFCNTNLREGTPMSNSNVALHRIDPSRLFLNTAVDLRCYFVGEGAGYHNSLGFNTREGDSSTFGKDPKLIFPDASEGNSRTSSEPLKAGDFVNMGKVKANTQLNFFLMADAVNGGKNAYSTNHQNPDGLVHAVAFTMPGTPYLLIAFEDLFGGGDRDYNDAVFTLDIGRANVDHLSSPEPATWLTLGGALGLAAWKRRRRSVA